MEMLKLNLFFLSEEQEKEQEQIYNLGLAKSDLPTDFSECSIRPLYISKYNVDFFYPTVCGNHSIISCAGEIFCVKENVEQIYNLLNISNSGQQ